jgi:vancomycin resistance protein YoaR
MKSESKIHSNRLVSVLVGGTIFIIFAFAVGAYFASIAGFEKFSSEFYIGNVLVGGKNIEETQKLIEQSVALRAQGIVVDGLDRKHLIVFDPSIINVSETIKIAQRVDGRNTFIKKFRQIFGMVQRTDVDLIVSNSAKNIISQKMVDGWHLNFSEPVNAKFEISAAGVTVVPEKKGQSVDLDRLGDTFVRALEQGDSRVIVHVIEKDPEITTTIAEKLRAQIELHLQEIIKGRVFKIKDAKFAMSAQDVISLIQPRTGPDGPMIGVDPENLKTVLGKSLAQFEQVAQDAIFEYDGSKIIKFQPHKTGVAIDWDALAKDLFDSFESKQNEIIVLTKESEPKILLESTNDLGIKEIIGVGHSDFSGSPKNRIHNIKTGVNSLKNILIAPGETFSLIKALGAIDASTGYLEELVIKDNKTQSEFGGGLCQIGTTTFRAAMGAGFSIVERQNHSYQVAYYFENGVSGTDATIYDPKPDFRFKNDTAHWVLLDPHINGSKLDFNFWGTSDGRKASRTIPKTLATKSAPPKVEIPTTTLAPGKVKCTEKAHSGATMLFTYTVEYPDGTIKKQDFQSYYKPWAEVCLIGVAPTSTVSS